MGNRTEPRPSVKEEGVGGREKEELLLAWGGREVVCRSLSFT